MNTQLSTLLTTLYVFLTDQILPDLGVSRVRRAGRKPVLTDAELLCLVVAQQLLAMHSETRWIRYAYTHLRPMFPGIPGQSGYNKRVRATGPLIAAVITALADRSSSGTKASPTGSSRHPSPGTSPPPLVRPDRKDEKPRFGRIGRIRQWIESVFDTLKGQLSLEHHGGRSLPGIYARVAARLLALAAGIWHKWHTGAPRKRSLIAYDH
ncbi:hypothetical protein J2X01_003400 [Arthrobacter ginsengisoli]|uniref:IS982 family transposase n=1 Tax=Arthrobacter ginsengisoli TaxID=1356565 RepID=A0ABU1UFY3_9MICC|nr:hypothetical protein [Arthrobacter ginsengisoli]